MIRKTIEHTKLATFYIELPNPNMDGMPTPQGTGFFISKDGYFLTANHVIKNKEGKINIGRPSRKIPIGVSNLKIIKSWEKFDIALLKADFEENKEKAFLQGKNSFDYLEIDFNKQIEGTPVYSYGFPLPEIKYQKLKGLSMGFQWISERTTSAIISSTYDKFGPIMTGRDPKHYIIDKALNYGSSGCPLILSETGKVISLCSRFQPVNIPQVENPDKKEDYVIIPSLYGVTTSFLNIKDDLTGYI